MSRVVCCVCSETGDDCHNVTLQDVRAHRFKYKLDVICVRCTREVWVDILRAVRDSVDKHLGYILPCLFIISFWACEQRGREWVRVGVGEGGRKGGREWVRVEGREGRSG